MKIVGKTKDGYLVSMNDIELKEVMFGKSDLTNKEINEFGYAYNEVIDIQIHERFKSVTKLNNIRTKSKEYSSILYELDKIKDALSPIMTFIEIEQEKTKEL